ncbi:hypothetical protein E4H12_11410 [Candidatus Thorarchaeota archaeon]|nr:MAG: hypothetical protein E4H12_11410 [Candidatus Thorarchaeota archaeon]
MDATKQLTVEEIQGYLARGAVLLPHVYEHLLVLLERMEQDQKVRMLPISIFDLYHFRLRRKLTYRIEQDRIRQARKAA